MLFVDFRQAFGSVNRNRLYEAMKQMKIPDKFIRLTQIIMNVTQAIVKTDNKLSATFEFNAGVEQGDGLSAVPNMHICRQHCYNSEIQRKDN
jgi:hypothetical protein